MFICCKNKEYSGSGRWSSDSEVPTYYWRLYLPHEDRACNPLSFDDGEIEGVKVLDLRWSHQEDAFQHNFQFDDLVATKRSH